jgi:hypothetical protein
MGQTNDFVLSKGRTKWFEKLKDNRLGQTNLHPTWNQQPEIVL